MIILNFSHPLTAAQREALERMAGRPAAQVLDVPVHFDVAQPFAPQARALLDALALTSDDWQSDRVLVVVPSLGVLAAVLLAELHGRMGHFPSMARIRPVEGALTEYEAAEIINLQAVRDAARLRH